MNRRNLKQRERLGIGARSMKGVRRASLSCTAALLAWAPTQGLGLKEGFWAAMTAVVVAQSDYMAARSVGRDQILGALVGGLTAAGAGYTFGLQSWSFLIAAFTAILLCWICSIESAAPLAGLTATLLLLVPNLGSAQEIMASRMGEVAFGTLVAIMVLRLAEKISAVRR